jgi:tRNA G18 (ribose-2'-O)-methylase SpoU
MSNPMINYVDIIKETTSKHFNVSDAYKNNTVEHNQEICRATQRNFSVGVINVTGDLNVGMMVRTASLLGTSNFYIFGRKKFDKRSTVGAENYINIIQHTIDPLGSDYELRDLIIDSIPQEHKIIACEHGGYNLGSFEWDYMLPHNQHPVFLFGSESHGIPQVISDELTKVSIPQLGVLRSFNVSAAMSIMCWDYIKETSV